MLKCDLFRLIPCLLDIIDKDTENIWEDGLLDDGLLLFLGHSNSLCIKEEDCKILCRRVISRAESQFTEVVSINLFVSCFNLSDLAHIFSVLVVEQEQRPLRFAKCSPNDPGTSRDT
jgi:hypothetical protein